MSAEAQPTATPPAAWQWPVSLDTYDRSVGLRADEGAVLERLDQGIRHHHCRDQSTLRAPLERLTQPLTDALVFMGISPTRRQTTINALYQQMWKRQITYWGWSMTDWSDILDPRI